MSGNDTTGKLGRRTWLWGAALVATARGSAFGESPLEVAFRGTLPWDGKPIRLQSIRPGVESAVVTALAADPRMNLLAAACDDHSIRVIDLSSMKSLETLQGHRDRIRTLAFDPAGERLASAGNDGQILVWSTDDWLAPPESLAMGPAVACVRFSPSGQQLAGAGFDHTVRIYPPTDHFPQGLQCGCRDLRSIAYRSDQRMLAVAGRSGAVHLFDASDGRSLGAHELHRGRIREIAFRGDGSSLVSAGEDGTVVLFDTDRRERVHQLPITSGRLFALAIVDERHIAVAGSDNEIHIIDIDAARVIHTFRGHVGSVAALTSSRGWLYSGGFDATIRRWPVEPLQSLQPRIADGEDRLGR